MQLVFLTAACWGDGILDVTLHYASGEDERKELQVLDWNPGTRQLAPAANQRLAVQTRARRPDGSVAHEAEMFAQTIACDPQRSLQSLSISLTKRENPRGLQQWQANFPRNFTAAIFAINAQRAE